MKLALRANRKLQRDGGASESFGDRIDRRVKIGALFIELGDDQQARQVELFGKAPALLGLHFDAADAVNDDQRGIGGAQRALGVKDERGKARRVNEVDLRAVPLDVSQRAMDRSLADNLILIVIGNGAAFVNTAKAGRRTGVKQHRRHQRRFTRMAVTYNANVAYLLSAINLHGIDLLSMTVARSSVQGRVRMAPA